MILVRSCFLAGGLVLVRRRSVDWPVVLGEVLAVLPGSSVLYQRPHILPLVAVVVAVGGVGELVFLAVNLRDGMEKPSLSLVIDLLLRWVVVVVVAVAWPKMVVGVVVALVGGVEFVLRLLLEIEIAGAE